MDFKEKYEYLYNLLAEEYGENLTREIVNGYLSNRKTTLRVNTLKTDINAVKQRLSDNNIEFSSVPWADYALILENADETAIYNLDIFKNGEIYLQNLSSMIPCIVLSPENNADILDMAAAPGGKTTQLAMLTNNTAHITACEFNKARAEKLKYNLAMQGAKAYVMNADSRTLNDFLSFDQILLDAPCSGSGTVSSDPSYKGEFNDKNLKKTASLQKAMLKKALNLLKKGHSMTYSTCSVLKQENEDVVSDAIKSGNYYIEEIDEVAFKDVPTLPTSLKGTLCVKPNELYEGFFVAKITKK